MRYLVSATIFFVAFLFYICPAALAGGVSSSVPLQSWVYPAIDRLTALGVIQSSLTGNKPFTRAEVARLIVEAKNHYSDSRYPQVTGKLVERLSQKFSVELQDRTSLSKKSYFQPFGDVDLRYLYQDGQPSEIPRINSRQFALNYNNDGRDYSEHNNVELNVNPEFRGSDWFLLSWNPALQYRENVYSETQSRFVTFQSKVAIQLAGVELSAGRQSLWWGRGRHGSLVLTNNAESFDMVRVTNPTPVILPWIFSGLGPMKVDIFWTRMEEERTVAEPYFAGMRLDVKPFPWFELGASRCVMFGGEGRPDVGLRDFVTILGGKNLERAEDTSNSVAAIDFRLSLPFLWNAELYGEGGGEDEAGGWIANPSYIYGIYLPLIEPSGTASLRIEYADLSYIDNNSGLWYRHGIYKSGYTYKGKVLGHHVGGGAEDLFGELRFDVAADWWVSLTFDYEKRGADQPVLEKHIQSGCELGYNGDRFAGFRVKYLLDSVENASYQLGNDQDNHLVDFSVFTQW